MEKEKSIPDNSIDAMFTDAKASNEESARVHDQYSNLVHRVFVQSPHGRELMDIWVDRLLMRYVAGNDSTQIEVGINEGLNQFVRNIITTCKSVAETNNE